MNLVKLLNDREKKSKEITSSIEGVITKMLAEANIVGRPNIAINRDLLRESINYIGRELASTASESWTLSNAREQLEPYIQSDRALGRIYTPIQVDTRTIH